MTVRRLSGTCQTLMLDAIAHAMTPSSKRPEAAHVSPIRILLVDDEAIVRYGLSSILQVDPTVEVVGEAENGEAAIAKAIELQPDIVLMDLNMPVMDGVTAIAKIQAAAPQTKILVLTAYTEDRYLTDAMKQGAAGYLLKNTPPEDLVMLIQVTYKGYMQLGPKIGEKLSRQLQSQSSEVLSSTKNLLSSAQSTVLPLEGETVISKEILDAKGITPREQEVLQLIGEGASNREISECLHISEKTVKNHVSNLFRRLGLRDRTQLAIWINKIST